MPPTYAVLTSVWSSSMWFFLHHLFRVLALSLPPSNTIWHILMPHGFHTSCLLMLFILLIPFIYTDNFSQLLDFWSLLSSQVSLPCPVLSHFMAVYTVMIAAYVYNSFLVLGTSITLLTPHKFCAYISDLRGREDTFIQNELTLLHKLIWGPTNPLQSGIIWMYKEFWDKDFYWISRD